MRKFVLIILFALTCGIFCGRELLVKGHEVSINVNTKEGEFTEFTVTLPMQS